MRKLYIYIIIGIASLLWSACTDVQLCDVSVHPHLAQVSFKFNWGTLDKTKPDSMYVIVSRPLNTYHDYFSFPSVNSSPVGMKSGEYFMVACNKDSMVDIVNLNEFKTDFSNISLEDLALRMKSLKREEVPQLAGMDWIDFSPGYSYMANTGAFFADVQNYISIYTGNSAEISFFPKILTQNITIRLEIETDNSVQLEEIMAEIAGIPMDMNPYNGIVNEANLGKMIYSPDLAKRQDNVSTFEGTISVFGLVAGQDEKAVSGPGVLQIAVLAKSESKKKIFRAGVNISKLITEAGLLKSSESGEGNVKAKETATLIIDRQLKIKAGEIEKEEEDGVSGWFTNEENGDINVDI